MPHFTVVEELGRRVTVETVGFESAEVLALHDLGLHPEWPAEVARYPDPPAIRTRTRLWVRTVSIVPQRIVEVA